MSLLLDALKKAAAEKNKAVDAAENATEKDDEATSKGEQSDPIDDFDLSLDDEALQDVAQQGESIAAYKEEYQIDNPEERGERQKKSVGDNQGDYDRLSKVVSTNIGENAADAQGVDTSTSSIQPDQVIRAPDRAGGNLDYDVSDEALDLLIHKTNRSYRKNKIVWVVLVSILSLTVLVTGGVYFTEDMQSEVEFLEARHNQSMRLVREKTSNESLPDKSVIIESLIGDEAFAKKIEFTKATLAKEKSLQASNAKQKKPKQKQSTEKNSNGSSNQVYVRKSVLSIEKSQQADPVSLLLDDAWRAYNKGDLAQANKAYEEVLRIEKNNRDALLGRGAIALQNKLFSQAKNFYLAILEINPRDPDAIAALTSLVQTSNTEASQIETNQIETNQIETNQIEQQSIKKAQSAKSEKYLKSLLQENKQSPVLNFSLGSIYASQKRWKLAQDSFFTAWVNDENNPGYAYNLAISLDQMGKANEAKRFYQACLRLSENKKVPFSKQSVLDRIAQINRVGIH